MLGINRKTVFIVVGLALLGLGFGLDRVKAQAPPPENPQSGAVGVQGTIPSPPPEVGATITIPTTGQNFTNIPITVAGTCPTGLLVKVYKNNVFSGAVECEGGSFSLQMDLFPGTNDLVARVFDDLDQPGPDSNIVTVTYTDNRPGAGPRISLSSIFAKRGVDPGQTLTWPIILSGGRGPYAISVDWGDGKDSDLISLEFPGTFDIEHVYDNPGIYNVVVRGTDADDVVAFLQLVAVANGPAGQDQTGDAEGQPAEERTTVLWQPAALALPFLVSAFWLGRKFEFKRIKDLVAKGQNPFIKR